MPTFFVIHETDDDIIDIAFMGSNGKTIVTAPTYFLKSVPNTTPVYPLSGSANGIQTVQDVYDNVANGIQEYEECKNELDSLRTQ